MSNENVNINKYPLLVIARIIADLNEEDKAMVKALINAIIIPVIITYLTSNILISFSWILLITIIYKYIKKDKEISASYFFGTLRIAFYCVIFYTLLVAT